MGWFLVVAAMVVVTFVQWPGRRVRRFPGFAASNGWTYDRLRTELGPGEEWAQPEVGAWVQQYVFSGTTEGGPFLTYECQARQQGAITAQGIGLHYVMVLVPTPTKTAVLDVFPTNWASRVAEALGADKSTELESDEFNSRFQVVAAERQLAVDVLRPEFMDSLMASEALACRITGGVLSLRYDGHHDLGKMRYRVNEAQVLRDAVPDWVWQRWEKD